MADVNILDTYNAHTTTRVDRLNFIPGAQVRVLSVEM